LSLLTSAAQNLASPAVLFFLLGVGASRLRSDLEVPPPVSKALSLYLVFSIGFRGGSELALGHGSLSLWVLLPLALGLAASTVGVAFLLLRLLGGRVGMEDRAAVAAHYGSVSVATFAAATAYLGSQGLAADGSLLVLLAAMEVPGILLALSVGLRASQGREGGLPWHELLTSAPLLLLMGSMAVGLLSGAKGQASLAPVVEGVFPGLLCLFLLDMGVVAGRRLNASRRRACASWPSEWPCPFWAVPWACWGPTWRGWTWQGAPWRRCWREAPRTSPPRPPCARPCRGRTWASAWGWPWASPSPSMCWWAFPSGMP